MTVKQQEICEELTRYLGLRSKLIAVKMLKNEEEVPESAVRPLRDMGHHLSLCQAFSMSRRQGTTLALFLEDNWCCEPVIGYGLGEPPQYFLDGHNRYPASAKTLEAGSRWAHQLPKLEPGKYVGVLTADWATADFEPEAIIMYCDPAQLTHLMIAVNWIDGNDVPCLLGGHSACVYAVVSILQNKKFYVSVPCIGDRKRALAQDNELLFSFAPDMAEELIEGLKGTSTTQVGFPIQYDVKPEYPQAPAYKKIGQLMGIISDDGDNK